MGVVALKELDVPAPRRSLPVVPTEATPQARWTLANAHLQKVKAEREAARARCAWLLAVDVAEKAVEGVAFARIYLTPGKVGRGSDALTTIARKLACYLTSTVGDCEVAAVARVARLNRKTVTGHVREVEDWRDDPAVDQHLDDMAKHMIAGAAALVMANMGEAA